LNHVPLAENTNTIPPLRKLVRSGENAMPLKQPPFVAVPSVRIDDRHGLRILLEQPLEPLREGMVHSLLLDHAALRVVDTDHRVAFVITDPCGVHGRTSFL
jgi:hypothetical protein